MKLLSTIVFTLIIISSLQAQSILGTWTTVDDATGEHKSMIEIYENAGKVYGKLVHITRESSKNDLCTKCKNEDKNKPLLGLVIIKDLTEGKNCLENGTITDPENGKTYRAKLWLDENNPDVLNVRGYVAFFYRTQQWLRVK